jgi:3-ketosteroid 9alpha-monooxygenase subunit A
MARYEFNGYPTGWFVIGFSEELAVGGVKALKYFDQALVLYRGEDGVARVRDGYCPHLGAHIGAGGKVVGNGIRCPFHHWVFDEGGQCVEIPYGDGKIPAKARIAQWTVLERNQIIYLWHDRHGREPLFDVPVLPIESEPGEWLPWRHACLRIKTHSREIVENVVDVGHFAPVHGTHVEKFENEFEDHMAVQKTSGIAYPRGGGKDRFSLVATYYGPGYQISDMHGFLHSMLINAHTMVDGDCLDLRFGVSIKPTGVASRDEAFQKAYVENLTTGFLEDVAIWENKCYREVPLLCGADGPIMKLRKWYAQFYA